MVLTIMLSGMRSSLSLREEDAIASRTMESVQEAESAAASSAVAVSAVAAELTATAVPTVTAEPTDAPSPTAAEQITTKQNADVRLFITEQTGHPALMALEADGLFHADNCMTRGQFCLLLSAMLDGLPEETVCPYPDVAEESEAYEAITRLYFAGILTETEGENFVPSQYVSRAWAAAVLRRLSSCFSGSEQTRALALADDVAVGATSEKGTVRGESELLRRGEVAVIFVRLAGRDGTLDEDALFFSGNIPADMDTASWAWAYVTDALTEGSVETAEPGVYRLYGWLYAAWDDGSIMRDMDYGVGPIGQDGRYTTGSEELDGYLAQALEESGANDLAEQEEALAAVYLYIKNNFEYLVMAEDMTTEDVGTTGWEYARALRFFQNGGGTCYGYSAAFGLLARLLGETAYIVAGQVNQYYGAHSWVVIPEDGINWIYDVELEDARPERHGDLALFHIQNYEIYNYWYEPDW
ncbi:MAG: S-layer homology domain-containing protein [Oscillospiraceae bacterium]|nr:S-layer homology domain-containing protein [Oscillospiraceae bacterium]